MSNATDQQRATHHQPQRLPSKVRAAAFYDLNSLKRHQVAQEGLPAKKPRTPSFNPLHCCFTAFKTQQAAFDFLDKQTCAPILRTFACETAATGQRDFIVTSAELFWQHYIETPAKGRHHYEIIRQGSPCNLYFDLEYHPEFNPAVNGAQLVTLLVAGVKDLLYELFGIPWDPNYVLELDSSTASKFSRHLIICLPGLAFADACHAGRFARCVLLRLLHTAVHSSCYGQLLVRNKDGGLTTFVDMGVYTRNRAFRLYLSSKFGKAAVLRTTHRFRGATLCPKAAFMDSLVTVLKPCCVPASSTRACFSTSSSQRHRDRSSQCRPALSLLRVEDDGQQELLQLPLAWQQVAMLQLRPLPHCQHTATAAAAVHNRSTAVGVHAATPDQRFQGSVTHLTRLAMLQASGQPCTGPSPLPLLDRFIGSICSAGGVQGEVRSWLLQPGSSCVLYNIKNNRWCGNIGRPHKSNGIYFCVDLCAGVYYQKCYDPECRLYRSEQMPLPTDVWTAYRHLCVPSDAQAAPQQQQGNTASALMPVAVTSTSSSLTQGQLAEDHGRCPAALVPAGAQHAVATSGVHCAGAHNCSTAAGCSLQPKPTAAGSCMSDDVDDDECLQLLLQVEQQQRQQEQPQQSRCAAVLTLTE